jgi:isoaspartyl peptidase/L-asparaginase-like protein (Ntn-hydrolase superfamily)
MTFELFVGLIAVDYLGNVCAPFNSKGMYRGLADSKGLFDVKIWKDQ